MNAAARCGVRADTAFRRIVKIDSPMIYSGHDIIIAERVLYEMVRKWLAPRDTAVAAVICSIISPIHAKLWH